MPLPEWKKKLPSASTRAMLGSNRRDIGKPDIEERLRANMLQHDLVRPFGPQGASAQFTRGLDGLPLGSPPRKDRMRKNEHTNTTEPLLSTNERPPVQSK